MKKIALLLIIASLIAAFFAFNLNEYFSLEYIKSKQTDFALFYEQNTLLTMGLFTTIYISITALSLPAATILTLLGGGIFGLFYGTILVSLSSTTGATLAFLTSRYILKDTIQKKYSKKLTAVNEGIQKEGAYYLFALRLVPIFPFFLVNILMGISTIRTTIFFIVSQLGMLPATVIYVFVGTQLAEIDSLKGILNPKLILGFTALGLLPIIMKYIVKFIKGYNEKI